MITGEIVQNLDLSDQGIHDAFINLGNSKRIKRTLTSEERQQRRERRENTLKDLKSLTGAVSDSINLFKRPSQQLQPLTSGIDYSYEVGAPVQGKNDNPPARENEALEKYVLWGAGLLILGLVAFKLIKNKQTANNL